MHFGWTGIARFHERCLNSHFQKAVTPSSEQDPNNGFDINSVDNLGNSVLIRASENGSEAIVRFLLNRGDIKINLPNGRGRTALMLASEGGHEGVVKALLEQGDIQVNLVDSDGDTAHSDQE